MNSLKSFSVDARAETTIAGAERKGEAETGISEAGKTGASTLATGVALGLTDGGAVVLGLEGAERLKRKDLSEPLADLIGPAAVTLLARF